MTSVPGEMCKATGCDDPVKALGWCIKHYHRVRKYGDPDVLKRPKSVRGLVCSVDGCNKQVYVRGWCSKHFQRWKANGDPTLIRRREKGTGSVTVEGYEIVTVPGHPLANRRGTLKHRVVLFDKIGPGPHPCHWCHRNVHWMIRVRPGSRDALVVDHLNFDRRDNDPDNLVPSCWSCNIKRTRARAGVP